MQQAKSSITAMRQSLNLALKASSVQFMVFCVFSLLLVVVV